MNRGDVAPRGLALQRPHRQQAAQGIGSWKTAVPATFTYPSPPKIGGRIRAMRLAAGLTPAALAEKVGVPREVVVDLEAGKIEPRSDLVEQIAVAQGRRLRDF